MAMAAASFSSTSTPSPSSSCAQPRPSLASSRNRRHCLSLSVRNARPTFRAMSLLESQDVSTHSCLQEYEQNLSPLHTQNSRKDSLRLHSVSLLLLAALPAGTITEIFEPIAELVRSLGLPDWLVHWGHPGNMAVVLFAMGGYGSYLGWQIRLADDMEVKAKAKDLHPKLLGGMFFFFALGATGGILSLLTSGKPIFESPHAITGLSGLTLLTIQTALTGFFESNPSVRGVHGVLGTGIMLLFLVHAVFGLQLGLSY